MICNELEDLLQIQIQDASLYGTRKSHCFYYMEERFQEARIMLDATIGRSPRTLRTSLETLTHHHSQEWEIINKVSQVD